MSSGGKDPRPVQAALRKILEAGVEEPVSITFGGTPGRDGVAEYRAVPIKADLKNDLRGLVETWRSKFIRSGNDRSLREFDSAPQPEDAQGVQYLSLADDEFLRRAIGAIGPPTDIPEWTRRDRDVGKPRSFVISVKLHEGGRALFCRRLTPAKQLRGPGKVVAFLEGTRFQALEEQRVILLEDTFDCVEYGGNLFILNPPGFESLFAYVTRVYERANEVIGNIQPYIDTSVFDALRQKVGSNRSYMRRIVGKVLLDLSAVDVDAVRQTVTEWGLNVTVTGSGGELILGFARGDPTDLIRVLTESAVRSAITGRKFIATAKTEVATDGARQ